MAKKKIKFKTTDGMKPRKSEQPGKPFELRAPMDVRIGPQSKQEVKLGLTCQNPLIVTRGQTVRLVGPGEPITVLVENPTNGVETIGQGEVVARAFVLDNSDNELAE